MIERLMGLPKAMLVTLLLGGGILLVVMFNPPYTVCDSQLEIFKKNQTNFLYLNPREKMAKTTQIELLNDRCKSTNAPGGCYELFLKMKQLLTDLEHVPKECASEVTSLSEVRKALWKHLHLMSELAWGTKPPSSFYDKLGWLDPADLALHCRLKKTVEDFYGESEFNSFREKLFQELPGAAGLPRNQAWDMMLLSVNCNQYL